MTAIELSIFPKSHTSLSAAGISFSTISIFI
jgi:hypothetical protein